VYCWDNTWSAASIWQGVGRDIFFRSQRRPVDYYIVYGPIRKSVVKTYAWLTALHLCRAVVALATSNQDIAKRPRINLREMVQAAGAQDSFDVL